jgi:Flp pilus assembly protein TadB
MTLKSRVKECTHPRKVRGIRRIIMESREILRITGKSGRFTFLCRLAVALFLLGAFIAIAMSNIFLIPVLAIGMSLLPFWYVIFTAGFYKKQMNAELETALSVITASYLRSESIITAIEENITYLNPPVADVFRGFLTQTRLISSNVALAIESLKQKLDSGVFHEWCDAVAACQEDKNLKSTLLPIVSKLSDMRVVSAELDLLLYEPLKEFITMAALVVGNIPLLYFLNRNWYNTLMHNHPGQAVLAASAAVVFVSLAAVVRLSKPIEYRR